MDEVSDVDLIDMKDSKTGYPLYIFLYQVRCSECITKLTARDHHQQLNQHGWYHSDPEELDVEVEMECRQMEVY